MRPLIRLRLVFVKEKAVDRHEFERGISDD